MRACERRARAAERGEERVAALELREAIEYDGERSGDCRHLEPLRLALEPRQDRRVVAVDVPLQDPGESPR